MAVSRPLEIWRDHNISYIIAGPLIGQPNPEEELRLLEEAANAKYGAYDEQLKTKARLEEENVAIEDEKKALLKEIEKSQGNLSEYHERQAKANAQKADLEVQLDLCLYTEQSWSTCLELIIKYPVPQWHIIL